MQNKGKYTIRELRAKCQHTGPKKETQTYLGLVVRYFSIYFTKYLIKTNLTPNQITAIGTAVYLLGAFLLAFNNYSLSVFALFLLFFATILDASDGEVARFHAFSYGYGGSYVEPLTHDIMYAFMFLPIAYGAYLQTHNPLLFLFGAIASVSKLVFRLMTGRFFYGVTIKLPTKGQIDPTVNFVQQSRFNRIIYRLYRNLCTSSGILLPLFIAVIFNRLDIFVVFYAVIFSLLLLGLFIRQMRRFINISKQVYECHTHLEEMREKVKGKKLIVFDLDGTLLDSMGIFSEIASYLISWRYKVDRTESRRRYIETSGIPFFKQLELIFPGHYLNRETAQMFEQRKVYATDHLLINSEDKETLDFLVAKGYKIAVSSNNFQENVDRSVKEICVPFTYVLGYRDGFSKGKDHLEFVMSQEKINPEQIVFVADSLSDLRFAKKYSIDFIAKLGTFSQHDFENILPGVVTINSIQELRDIF